jgi:hypothetical protein
MGSKTSTKKSSSGAQARNAERQANTAELMSNIMAPGAGEISKAREKQLQDAANKGRGVKFIPGNPYVGGDNVFRIDPATGEKVKVMRTGTTAADFTGNIIANKPTTAEFFGDMGKGLFGGQADAPQFNLPTGVPGTQTQNFASMLPAPEKTQGIIPALINTGGIGGLALNLIKDLYSSGTGKVKDFFSPAAQPQPDPFSSGADAEGGAFALLQSLVPQDIETDDIPAVDKRARLKELVNLDVAPGSQELNVDGMTDQEVDLRLQSYGEPLAMGGLIPPERGPQSEGIESLFKNK